MKHCQWCDAQFKSKVSYQIYCSEICRAAATKEKIAAKYQITKRGKRSGRVRRCKSCGSDLSIYNDEPLCTACNINPADVNKILKQIKRLANGKDI